jgi:dihydroxy-acid dehydratase
MDDIDMLSRKAPVSARWLQYTEISYSRCKPCGGIIAIMDELAKGGLIDTSVRRVDGMSLAEALTNIQSPARM